MNRDRWLRLIVSTMVMLFFVQALRALFSTMFGILYDQIFAGTPTAWLPISLALVLLSMAAPRLADIEWMGRSRLAPAAWAAAASLARIPLTLNDADVRYAASLVVVAAGGVFLALRLRDDGRRTWSHLVMALAVDQLLRMAGDTYDLSLHQTFLGVQILVSLAVAAAAFADAARQEERAGAADAPLGTPLAWGAILFLETSLLSVGNATARWSGVAYAVMAPLTLAVTFLSLHPMVEKATVGTRAFRLAWLLALPFGLMLGTSAGGWWAGVGLLAAHLAALMAWRASTDPSQPTRRPGRAVAWGMGLFLLLHFLNAFTFTYPYTLPALRGLGWAVYLVASLLAGLPLLRPAGPTAVRPASLWAGAAAVGAVILAGLFVWPRPPDDRLDERAVRLATYNIHYGYDEPWGLQLAAQAEAIRSEGVDLIALQEVDTGRMTSYMADDAYFLSRRLGMREAYLPTVEHLTGIAVLYRGAGVNVERLLLTSLQEQTGIVHVEVDVAGRPMNLFGLWLGLSDEDTQRQIKEALAFVGDRSPAALGGDFNADPGSPVYEAVRAAGLFDPFLALGIDPAPPTSPAAHPTERIDYVFLRGLSARQASVSASLASDHRMAVVEVDLTLPPLPGLARP